MDVESCSIGGGVTGEGRCAGYRSISIRPQSTPIRTCRRVGRKRDVIVEVDGADAALILQRRPIASHRVIAKRRGTIEVNRACVVSVSYRMIGEGGGIGESDGAEVIERSAGGGRVIVEGGSPVESRRA